MQLNIEHSKMPA
ncbi:unnamed protein product, partial [Allacma fusca]